MLLRCFTLIAVSLWLLLFWLNHYKNQRTLTMFTSKAHTEKTHRHKFFTVSFFLQITWQSRGTEGWQIYATVCVSTYGHTSPFKNHSAGSNQLFSRWALELTEGNTNDICTNHSMQPLCLLSLFPTDDASFYRLLERSIRFVGKSVGGGKDKQGLLNHRKTASFCFFPFCSRARGAVCQPSTLILFHNGTDD